MNRKPALYTLVGLLAGGASTALVLWLTLKPFSTGAPAYADPGSSSASPQTVPGQWGMMGDADQHFIVIMIPHHEGAIDMADLALERAQHPEIRTLAESIKTTQSQEIAEMRTWYQQWYNAEVPNWTPGMGMGGDNGNGAGWNNSSSSQPHNWMMGMGMHRGWQRGNQELSQSDDLSDDPSDWQPGMGCMGMNGMMGDTTVLENASDFDRAFLEEMIPHHQMGLMMAQMVLMRSDRPEIQELAQSIIDTQTAEINQMQQWYQAWY